MCCKVFSTIWNLGIFLIVLVITGGVYCTWTTIAKIVNEFISETQEQYSAIVIQVKTQYSVFLNEHQTVARFISTNSGMIAVAVFSLLLLACTIYLTMKFINCCCFCCCPVCNDNGNGDDYYSVKGGHKKKSGKKMGGKKRPNYAYV